ncbi:hypothetical protein TVAG_390820 [Trichomonas vaginalis G3]|uniref:Ubiquitin-like domain-containing protein n=1 Tax=Trichomonas vaginalis (strain ATCC PRA-98 / G3) TaxID=412133 RepID=A2FDZ6_TRIV3|nr:negative regulation of ER-associated ubiquitin-dependent protein catabolic process [Trichomonas vaginalis G3]EAX96875.1 hypothetical protein TVAG_390820 [Trichomonas vaginalis G3]KAI5534792.1 negative regulation of ER-associated ubiquitin-dependent protein catabolic process [Trichomonas vaginalis G3]|eukprot:XP_001309805.1 hypothetical protein [Trichomonas vaginalis G3]
MDIKVKYKADTYNYQIKKATSNSGFIKQLAKDLNLDSCSIKLIYKGKNLANSKGKIIDEGITEGATLLLFAVDKSAKLSKPKRSSDKKRSKISSAMYEEIPIPEIVKKGPPPGCMDGLHTPVSKFPKQPFVVYTKDGSIAKLSIESDAIFVEAKDGNKERLFDVTYNSERTKEVPNYPNYISLCLNTNDEMRVYHYIPKQYQNIFKDFFTSLMK